MEFVSFDIECANSYQGRSKICSFGYCVTDETFTVLHKEDLPINPKARFQKGMSKIGAVHLAYSEEEFRNAPLFSEVYDSIASVLEGPDKLVIGHSIGNDIGYLRGECDRYRLPQLSFRFIDAQTIHRAVVGAENAASLEKIAAQYHIEFTAHKSDDDAYATVAYLGEICREAGANLLELMQNLGVEPGEASADGVIQMKCAALETGRKRAVDEFKRMVERSRPLAPGPLSGKRFCVNLNTERRDLDASEAIVKRVNELGGKYVLHARDCNVFVFDDEKPCAKCRSALVRMKKGDRIELITEAEFLDLLKNQRQYP